jgi:hypothetical protein
LPGRPRFSWRKLSSIVSVMVNETYCSALPVSTISWAASWTPTRVVGETLVELSQRSEGALDPFVAGGLVALLLGA